MLRAADSKPFIQPVDIFNICNLIANAKNVCGIFGTTVVAVTAASELRCVKVTRGKLFTGFINLYVLVCLLLLLLVSPALRGTFFLELLAGSALVLALGMLLWMLKVSALALTAQPVQKMPPVRTVSTLNDFDQFDPIVAFFQGQNFDQKTGSFQVCFAPALALALGASALSFSVRRAKTSAVELGVVLATVREWMA